LTVVIGEIAAEGNLSAYESQVVRRHKAHVDLFRSAVLAGQREGKREDAPEALEFVLRRFAQIDKIRIGKGKVLDAAIAHVRGNNDELIGVFVRERAQQHGIGDAKDGGARAYAQGNSYCGGECENGTLAQCSTSERQIS